ncbi:MAG: methyltransferase [Candidatus Dormibacteria bacterium]
MADDVGAPRAAPSQVLELLNAFLTAQALHAAAMLGIADLLAAGPATMDDLATATSAHAPSLYRLLRMLTGTGVLREEADGRFALTALGRPLRSDEPDSVHDWALYVGARAPWEAWGRLHEAVVSGEPGFVLAHGVGTYEYLASHPDLGAPFDRWMTRQSEQHNAPILAALDLSGVQTVADIGGGQGSLLGAILQANPSVRGILLDLPHVVADPVGIHAGVADRCDVVGGDLLQAVPAGADVYVMKRVLMIWSDETAIRALQNCAEALPRNGRVLVVEMVMRRGNDPSPAKSFDLLMLLANPGGCVRSEEQFPELFAAAGLRLTRVIPTSSPNSIIEAVPA